MKTIILSIGGMSCSACSNGIEKYLNKQNGIFDAKVNLVMANATITYDEKILDIPKIEKYIEKSGYKSLGLFKNFNIEKKKKNEKLFFIIFTILAIILMYISMAHMINLPLPEILEPHKSSKIYSSTLLILTIPFLIYGFDILKSGYNNLIHKMPNMDTLVFQKLVEITPETATIVRNGIETVITLDEIQKGDILIAKPGQKIAVDGEIIERTCTF